MGYPSRPANNNDDDDYDDYIASPPPLHQHDDTVKELYRLLRTLRF